MMVAQVAGVIGSGVPSVVAPVDGITTLVTVSVAFLVASVLFIALARRART
jgi:hypothetical protein